MAKNSKKSAGSKAAKPASKETIAQPPASAVGLSTASDAAPTATGNSAPATVAATADEKASSTMTPITLVLTRNTSPRKGNTSVFNIAGLQATVRVNNRAFAGAPPESLSLSGEGFASPKGPKVKLTKEERAALPKPTPAEKLAIAQKSAARAAARVAKLAAAAGATA